MTQGEHDPRVPGAAVAVLVEPAPPTPQAPPAVPASPPWWRFALGLAAVVLAVWLAVYVGANHLHRSDLYTTVAPGAPGQWFEGWARWDGYWYRSIVEHGYVYYPDVQSSVAFFPAYPATLWLVSRVIGNVFVAGSLLTLASGVTAAWLFRSWARAHTSPAAAATALALFCLYPYALYLYGPVYGDAFFLALAIGAFVALERDQVALAGLLGFAATAARPVGIAVAIGLVVRLVELRRAEQQRLVHAAPLTTSDLLDPPLRRRDGTVFLAFGGFVAWCTFLWWRWGDPLLFSTIQGAPGWDQAGGLRTWSKATFFSTVVREPLHWNSWQLVLQAALGILVVCLVPRVIRRLGWGYGVLTLIVVAVPLIGSKDFMGMGRYLLPAFPIPFVIGEWLAQRPRMRVAVLAACAGGLLLAAVAFGNGQYIA